MSFPHNAVLQSRCYCKQMFFHQTSAQTKGQPILERPLNPLFTVWAVHLDVRVWKRAPGAVGVRRVCESGWAAASAVQSVCVWKQAAVQQVCGSSTAAVTLSVQTKIIHIHKPLGPELPPDPLAVHGQVNQLTCAQATEQQQWGLETSKHSSLFIQMWSIEMIIRTITYLLILTSQPLFLAIFACKCLGTPGHIFWTFC